MINFFVFLISPDLTHAKYTPGLNFSEGIITLQLLIWRISDGGNSDGTLIPVLVNNTVY